MRGTSRGLIAAALAGCVLSAGAKTFEARSLSLNATFDEKGRILSLLSADNFDYAAYGVPLFGLELTRTDDFKKRLKVTAEQAKSVEVKETPEGVVAVYTGFREGIERVEATVRGDDRLRFGISVKVKDGWALEKTVYPRIRIKAVWDGKTRDERITNGHADGGCFHPLDPEKRKGGFRMADRPGRMSMQYAGMFSPKRGFTSIAEDPENESKFLNLIIDGAGAAGGDPETMEVVTKEGGETKGAAPKGIPALVFDWSWKSWQTGTAKMPYEITFKGITGSVLKPVDWRDVADVYREWVMPQGWSAEPLAERKDLPDWMKQGPAKTFFKRMWIADPDEIRRWVKEYYRKTFPTTPLIVSFWGWEHQDLWVGPDYFPAFPSEDGFKSLLADLKAEDAHTFLWPSGFRWLTEFDRKGDGTCDFDDRADWEAVAKPHAVLKRDGSEKFSSGPIWWRGGTNKEVCGGEQWARDWFIDNAKKMIDLGAESIQIDQQGGGYLAPCYATNHGHTPGEGVWKVRAFTTFLEQLKAAMEEKGLKPVLGMEAPGDEYNRFWAIQDHRDAEADHACEWASTFNWLYHDRVATFQSNMFLRRHDRPFVAHCAVDGQLAYVVPSRGDYAIGEPVVWNGGLEKAAPNGEFVGWERLRGEYTKKVPTEGDPYWNRTLVWTGRAYLDENEVHSGRRSVRLETLNEKDVVGFSNEFFTDDECFRAGATYRFSAWVKTGELSETGVDEEGEYNVMEACVFEEGQKFNVCERTRLPAVGAGWQRISVDFKLPPKATMMRVVFKVRGKARVWVDDVELEVINKKGAAKPVVFTGRSPYLKFVRQWVDLYHGEESRKYLAHGRQIRGAEVVSKTMPYKADCFVNLTYNAHPYTRRADLEALPVVVSQSYEAADGTKALFLANATAKAQNVKWTWMGKTESMKVEPDTMVMVKLPEEKVEQVHDYFTDEALQTADMDGVDGEIAAALSKCEAVFGAAEKLEGDQVASRLLMARRLETYVRARAAKTARDEKILAWQGAMELEAFFEYFAREAARAERKAKAPAPVRISVKEFGAVGDGQTDDGPAFRKALAAAADLKGKPVVIEVPEGVYAMDRDPRCPIKDYACRNWQMGEDGGVRKVWKGENISCHILMENLENVTLRGAGEKSVLLFRDSTIGGIRLCGCAETTVENLALDYPENPSTQGTVVKVEEEPFALVLKIDDGYPAPDLPRFLDATSRYFSPVGENMMYLPSGVARMGTVERIGDGLFRLRPYTHHLNNEVWRAQKAGSRLCIMARYAEGTGGSPVRALNCAFCTIRNLRAYDAPGQVFTFNSCYAYSIIGCRAVGRDGSDDIVTSNADAILGSGRIGPYIAGCEFRGLEDDGINVGTGTGDIPSIAYNGRIRQHRESAALLCRGGFVTDGITGRVKMFFRYGEDDLSTRKMPADVVPGTAVRQLSAKDKRKYEFNSMQKKGEKRADRNIRIPGTVGAVLKDTSFSRIRGRGIQVHCANMLIDNVKVSDVTGVGIAADALLAWGMCFNVHNIYVRNCVFERLGSVGAQLNPTRIVDEPLKQRMHFSMTFENCVFAPAEGKPAAILECDDDILFKGCTFKTNLENPIQVRNSTNVRIEK